MRVDKFLKLSRLVKRRTVACEMADAGAVRINGRIAKPSSSVDAGDTVEVAYPRRVIEARVITSDEREMKRGAASVEIVAERRVEEDERPWQIP